MPPVSTQIRKKTDSSRISERVLANPSSEHLIPVLQKLPYVLVIEDFHYLNKKTQIEIFQQWKSFIDNQVSVVVVGTTHHAVDIARSNQDLLGRICRIDLGTWSLADLKSIVHKGLNYIGISDIAKIALPIAIESAGLPIITQQTCLQLFVDKEIFEIKKNTDAVNFTTEDVYKALNKIANQKYSQLEEYYLTLAAGPRLKYREFNTYEILLSCFIPDPLKFSLSRRELYDRIAGLPIPVDQVPPSDSIEETLKELQKFQSEMDIELLEWREKEATLHILEPSFLFYIRCRVQRDQSVSMTNEIYKDLITEWKKKF